MNSVPVLMRGIGRRAEGPLFFLCVPSCPSWSINLNPALWPHDDLIRAGRQVEVQPALLVLSHRSGYIEIGDLNFLVPRPGRPVIRTGKDSAIHDRVIVDFL